MSVLKKYTATNRITHFRTIGKVGAEAPFFMLVVHACLVSSRRNYLQVTMINSVVKKGPASFRSPAILSWLYFR